MVSTCVDNQPSSLLVEFLENDRSDVSFARIVEATAGIVHSSALRRTGNASLAEEVAQNVYIILARKAESLRKHPSLTAWLYRVTSFEAEKVLRRESRHQRRVEKFISEPTQSVSSSELNEDNLRLLEQAVDRLSEKDQALVLARFFEQKKFREIAAATNQSEAACKVRLRRVMDKMGTWLNARGCTMSVAALASILTSEWSRACPLSPSAKSSAFLKAAPVSQSLLIPKITTSMKISKMTFAGLALLFGAVATSVTLIKEESEPPLKTTELSINSVSSSQENQVAGRKRQRSSRSLESLLSHYPFAYERLEQLYAKYPELRLAKFTPTEGDTIVDSLNQYFESLDKGVPVLPGWVKAQLSGKEEWDHEKIAMYLEENDGFLTRLLEISKLPKGQPHFRYLIGEQSPELMNGIAAVGFLRAALVYQVREGSSNQAGEVYRAIMNLKKGVSEPFLIHELGRNSIEKGVFKELRDLAQEGYDLNFYSDESADDDILASYTDSLRLEVGSLVSLIEATKQFEDRDLVSRSFASIMPIDIADATPSLEDQGLMRETAMSIEVDEFQEIYAKVIADYLVEVDQWQPSEGSKMPTMVIDLEKTDLPRSLALILNGFLPRAEKMTTQILKGELLKRELTTWDALNKAVAAGNDPQEISDLVPEFLDKVPVNPMTNQAFVLDVEKRILLTEK